MKFTKIIIIIFIILVSLAFVVGSWVWFYSDEILPLGLMNRKEDNSVGVILMGGAYRDAFDGLVKGMTKYGYYQGKNISYLVKDLRGDNSKLDKAISDLKKVNLKLIYTISTPVTAVVIDKIGKDIPVVFNIVGDPIGAGFAKGYSGSGRNVSGCTNLSAELSGKRLGIFKEAFPSINRLITFYDPTNEFSQFSIESTRQAAEMLGISLSEVNITNIEDLEQGLASITLNKYQGIYITPDAFVVSHIDMIVERANALKIPTMGHAESLAKSGVTITYGADFFELGSLCANVINSVLEGGDVSAIPLITPDKLDLVINQKSLDDIGLVLSDDFLSRADKIIVE